MQKKLDDSSKDAKPGNDRRAADSANPYALADPTEFARNMVRVGQQSQKLLSDFLKRQTSTAGREPVDPLNIAAPFLALMKAMTARPQAVLDAQFQLWREFMGLWERTTLRMLGSET